jgi:1-acyl-sn-glycerol-3-phosphate acyltransferase
MPPNYRYPIRITVSILRDFLLGRRRSLASDAPLWMKGVRSFAVLGTVPSGNEPYLYLVNHYSREGFRAWWIAIALTSAVGRELHWPMTSAWTFPDPLRSRLLTPLTEWALARIARMYSFTLMPPMSPRERDLEARAAAVRRILRLARSRKPTLALAPEGMDSPDGRLMQPPPGAGRFIAHLAGAGYTPVPVGAYEEADSFCLRFGPPITLPRSGIGDADERDRETGKIVMEKNAELLPEPLFPNPSPSPSNAGNGWERGTG